MKVKILFQNLKGFEHHYQFIEQLIQKGLGKFEHKNHPEEVQVIVRETNKARNPQYESEVQLKGHAKKQLFAKKVSDNFFTAIRDSVKSLENLLRRENKKTTKRHRAGRKGGLPAPFTTGLGIIPFEF